MFLHSESSHKIPENFVQLPITNALNYLEFVYLL
jgi:hypothetical protein